MTISVSVENIWLTAKGIWNWRRQYWSSNDDLAVYKSLGWKCRRDILDKVRRGRVTVSDIPGDASWALANEVKLPWNEFQSWALIGKCVETGEGFEVTINIPTVWLNSTARWDWESAGYAHDRDYAVYKSRGIACSSRLLDRINDHLPSDPTLVPSAARWQLADKVGLDPAEFEHWAYDVRVRIANHALEVYVKIPNVWICADLFRGGSWWDQSFYGVGGGTLPNFVGTDIFTVSKKVFKISTVGQLLTAIENHNGKLWGMTLSAHGGRKGSISYNRQSVSENSDSIYNKPDKDGVMNQQNIMNALSHYKYKLSRIYMFQCFSGCTVAATSLLKDYKAFPSEIDRAQSLCNEVKTSIARQWKDHPGIRVTGVSVNHSGQFEVNYDVDWDSRWQQYGISVHTYQGIDAVLFDTDWVPGLTSFVEWLL